MGFLKESSNQSSINLDITETPKLVRPAAVAPKAIWVHRVPSVGTMGPDGKFVGIRRFRYEVCTSNGRSGAGCFLCNTPDPLWHKLPPEDQVNRKSQRVDFPKACRFLLPVFSHLDNAMFIMEGGSQLYENMDKWYDLQSNAQKDLRRCDWQVWKEGAKKQTRYKTDRLDASAYSFTAEQVEEAKKLLSVALSGFNPTDPAKLQLIITGQDEERQDTVDTTTYGLPGPQEPLSLPQDTYQVTAHGQQMVTFNTSATASAMPVPVPVPVAVPTVTRGPAPKSALDAFTSWVNEQKEFQGMGIVNFMLPVVKQELGHAEYQKCTPEQLEALKAALSNKLTAVRRK
jgi:hypothetical protein